MAPLCSGPEGARCEEGGRHLLGGLQDLHEPPPLRARERARLDDPDEIAHVRRVALVVSVELRRAPDHLLVAGMLLLRLDPDDDRLVHRARDDDAAALLLAAELALGLRLAGDRLALLRLGAGAGGLRPLPARRAR